MSKQKKGEKTPSDFLTPEIYKFYTSTCSNRVTGVQFSKIIGEFNKRLVQKIYEGFVFEMPAHLGQIGIRTSEIKLVFDEEGEIDASKSKVNTDWGATLKLWKEYPELKNKKYVYHLNIHTGGKNYTIKWKKVFASPFVQKYRFAPAKAFRRGFTKYINNSKKIIEYYDI